MESISILLLIPVLVIREMMTPPNEFDAFMNDSRRSGEMNSVVEAEAISTNLLPQGDNGTVGVLPTDRLRSEASKTVTVVYNARPVRGKIKTAEI